MNTHVIHPYQPAAEHPDPGRGAQRFRWFRYTLHTATLMSSMAVLMMLTMVSLNYDSYVLLPWTTEEKVTIAAVAGLLLLDRLDEWLYRPAPRRWLAVLLLVLRIVLVGSMDWLVPGLWSELFPLIALAFMAASYFGSRVGSMLAILVWVRFIAGFYADPYVEDPVREVLIFAVMLAAAAAAGNFTRERDRHRAEGEIVLANLEAVHTRVTASAERVRQATLERNHLVHEIHESVGSGLAIVDAHVDRARVTGPDEVIRMAKQVASEALQNVRRSVHALRATTDITSLHAVLDESVPSRPHRQAPPKWRVWLLGNSVDLLQGAGYLMLLLAYVLLPNQEYPQWTWQRFVVAGVLLSLLVIDHLEYGRYGDAPTKGPAFGVALLRLGLFVIFATLARGHWPLWLLFFVPHIGLRYAAMRGSPWLQAVIWAGVVVLVVFIVRRAAPLGYQILSIESIGFVFILLFGSTTSRTVLHDRAAQLQLDQLLAALQDSHAALKRSAEDELTAIEDRNRLARDIHDGLGHYLTVINIQLEKALAYWERDPQVAERAFLEARQMVGEALRDVEATTGELEAPQVHVLLPAVLQELVQHGDGSLTTGLQIVGSEAGFAPPALLALYRVAQEGLTNIQKHARASEITLHLAFGEQVAELDLCDNGQGFDPATLPDVQTYDTGHYGLRGLRERLEAVGGTLTIESTPGAGTRLHVVVPRAGRPSAV